MEDREKKPRFRDKEIEILVLGVKERSDIINFKFHDVIKWFEEACTGEVMEAVNAVSFSIKTVGELN